MKYYDVYKTINCNSHSEAFKYLIENFKDSNTYWDYFVNWTKVYKNIKESEVNLNILNYLIGKDNFEEEFKFLVKKYPSTQCVIPVLLAYRENNFKILTQYTGDGLKYDEFDFSNQNKCDDSHIEKLLLFVKETGLSKLFIEKKIKNLVDYVTGVEVGLDSNGRKNRGGTTMEDIVEIFIKKICLDNGYQYIKQATSKEIKSKFGADVPVDKTSRRYDFAVNNGKKVYLIETNFYGGGGSKLKSTAGEYKSLYNMLNEKGFPLIWITDGAGWKSTLKALEETFTHIDYLLNLAMLEQGILRNIIEKNL